MIIHKWNMRFHRKFPTGKEGYLSKIALIPRNFPVERPENVCFIKYPYQNFRNFLINGKRPRQRFSFPELRYIPLEKFAKICRIERDRTNAIKFEAARTHFLSDVFV